MITAIRDYVADAMAVENVDRTEVIDEFGDEEIYNQLDGQSYKLIIGAIECGKQGNEFFNQVSAIIEIYNDRSRDDRTSFDDLMDEAFCLRKSLEDPKTVPFTELAVESIEPFNLEGNDKFIGMRLTLRVREDYSY